MDFKDIIEKLKMLSDTKSVEGMAKFGITPGKAFGVSLPYLREIAKKTNRNHELALKLWEQDTRETRILAAMIAEPDKVTNELIDKWAKAFNYWEICDQCVMNLFEKTEFAWTKAVEYSTKEEEFIKRTGFVLMARLAVSDKKAKDKKFESFLPLIKREAMDNRKMVKKAINWALRQIGKRNLNLNEKAIGIAKEIQKIESSSAKWIASDALLELQSEAVQKRLCQKI